MVALSIAAEIRLPAHVGVPQLARFRLPKMHYIHLLVGERERANLVVSTADFSLYILYIYIYISGAGRF